MSNQEDTQLQPNSAKENLVDDILSDSKDKENPGLDLNQALAMAGGFGEPSSVIGTFGTLLTAGGVGSILIIPRLCDLYGRRRILLVALTFQICVWIALTLSKNLYLTLALQFCFGLTNQTRLLIFLFFVEFIQRKHQAYITGALDQTTTLAVCMSTLYFALVSKYYQYYYIFAICVQSFCAIGIFFLPETPAYLISKKRYDEARRVLIRIGKINRSKADVQKIEFKEEVIELKRRQTLINSPDNLGEEQSPFKALGDNEDETKLNGTLADLIKVKRHFYNLMILALLNVLLMTSNQLLSFTQKYFKGNLFVNQTITAVAQMPVIAVFSIILVRIGIKPSILIAMGCSLIGAITYLCVDSNETTVPIMTTAIRMGIQAEGYITHYVPAIIFPAIFRGTAIGFTSLLGQIISIAGPQLAELKEPTPLIIFCCLVTLSGILSQFLLLTKPRKSI